MSEIKRRLQPFTAIENDVFDDKRLTATDVMVYMALARHCGTDRSGFPSYRKIAAAARTSDRTAKRSVANLRKLGYLEVEKRHRKDGSQASNVYTIGVRDSSPPRVTGDTPPVLSGHPPMTPVSPHEQDSENKNQGTREIADAHFEAWWSLYPRKVAKQIAKAKYLRLLRDGTKHDTLIAGLKAHLKAWADEKRAKQYIPHPTTWLNQERWDEEDTAPAAPDWWHMECPEGHWRSHGPIGKTACPKCNGELRKVAG